VLNLPEAIQTSRTIDQILQILIIVPLYALPSR